MNPVSVLLMQNIKAGKFERGPGGVPTLTQEDSLLAGIGSARKDYLAARLIVLGDAGESTMDDLLHRLYHRTVDLVRLEKWDVPPGAEVYRCLSALSVAEHAHPGWFPRDRQRVIFFNQITAVLRPKAPIVMTIDKWWKKWKPRYKIIHAELAGWADTHLDSVANHLG